MSEAFDNYEDASQHQLSEWVAGRPWHNPISPGPDMHRDENGDWIETPGNGECCPDFSCCQPGMLWPEEKRRQFAEASDEQRTAMLAGALVDLLEDHDGVEVVT